MQMGKLPIVSFPGTGAWLILGASQPQGRLEFWWKADSTTQPSWGDECAEVPSCESTAAAGQWNQRAFSKLGPEGSVGAKALSLLLDS